MPGGFSLGIDVENFRREWTRWQQVVRLHPEYAAAMVTETIANYNGHDRAISTVAFVRFLRALMQEVVSAFERGVAAGGAQEPNEVLVDVVAEDP